MRTLPVENRKCFVLTNYHCGDTETKDLLFVDRQFVDEYVGSDYTRKLIGALPKVKANMSQGIFKVCNISEHCTGSECPESCIINRMIK